MHDLSKEFPSDRQIFRALRTWPDYKITDRLIFEHLDGLPSINVLVFRMRYSSEVRLDISDNKPFLFFVFLVLQNRLVFFFQLKPIFFQVNVRVNRLHNGWEAGNHTIMPHVFMSVDVIFMRQIQCHFNFQ